ncbi:hypothetical protein [Pararhodospirillum photometricum]|uniref:Uncharacterized protein n=1 Tax=Pararhodospirillum photometricum DSM 122 TaxID=1150469 RepID=H6SMT6_PARPM|nr:hypothetical protein [Pararhodospirillum photometricum]CCG09221.1 unnamed protein product [Pararhodospirillum photometricum DSM 122]
MPLEMRRLVFRDSEMEEAITLTVRAEALRLAAEADRSGFSKVSLPDAKEKVLSVFVTSDDPLELVATLVAPSGRRTTRFFPNAELIYVLIAYCKVLKIPVARSAGKSLHRCKGGVALDLILRTWDAPEPAKKT